MSLVAQLTREDAAKNAVLPYVLRRGSASHPTMEAVSAALDELYGASIDPVARKKGEIQCLGFIAEFPDDSCLPEGSDVLKSVASMLCDLLLRPNTRGGLLLPSYVEGEKEKLLEKIRGRINEKRSYSVAKLKELMCPFEDYAVPPLGFEEEADSIYYQSLTQHYRHMLASSPIEIFYCGSMDERALRDVLAASLSGLPRGEISTEIGTDVRMNTVEEAPRYFTEKLDVTQGKLAIGFRLGDCMEEPDIAAIMVFNALYGGSVTSKLFMNVRELLSLCYYASSSVDMLKGVMTVSSGIEFDKYEAAKNEIFAQLEAVRKGDFTDAELLAAKKAVASQLRSYEDNLPLMEDFFLSFGLQGLDCLPGDLAELADGVSKEDVLEVAKDVACDAVYFLTGTAEKAGEDQDGH